MRRGGAGARRRGGEEAKYDASRITYHVSRITYHVSRSTLQVVILITLLALLIALLWFFLASRDDGSLAEIRRRGTLRVGLDASFPPFETMDANGQIIGLDVDIARAVAADLGVEAELVNIGFDGLYDALLARRVDLIISGLPYDPHWTQDVAYTANYFNAGQVLVTRADESAIKTVENLAGHTVAVEWGSQAEMEGRRLSHELLPSPSERGVGNEGEISKASPSPPIITLLRQETAAAALDAVLNGQASTAIVDAPSALNALPRGIKVVSYLTNEWYAAAVHRESRELLGAVNQTLAQLEESGEMAKLQAKWFQGK